MPDLLLFMPALGALTPWLDTQHIVFQYDAEPGTAYGGYEQQDEHTQDANINLLLTSCCLSLCMIA